MLKKLNTNKRLVENKFQYKFSKNYIFYKEQYRENRSNKQLFCQENKKNFMEKKYRRIHYCFY